MTDRNLVVMNRAQADDDGESPLPVILRLFRALFSRTSAMHQQIESLRADQGAAEHRHCTEPAALSARIDHAVLAAAAAQVRAPRDG